MTALNYFPIARARVPKRINSTQGVTFSHNLFIKKLILIFLVKTQFFTLHISQILATVYSFDYILFGMVIK